MLRKGGIDWLRACAVGSVLLYHSNEAVKGLGAVTGLGWAGVDLFFVLSGFLVTMSWQKCPEWPTYLRRRAYRVLPAYLATLLLGLVVAGALAQMLDLEVLWRYLRQLPFYLAYQANLPSIDPKGRFLGPLWSLSVEVQLWLLLPLIAGLVTKTCTRAPWRTLACLLGAGVFFRLVVLLAKPGVVGPWAFPNYNKLEVEFGRWVYMQTLTRMDAFLVGLWLGVQGKAFRSGRFIPAIGLGLGMVALLLSVPFKTFGPRPAWMVLFQFTGISLGFGAAVHWGWQADLRAPRTVQWLSDRIYSVYLAQAVLGMALGQILVMTRWIAIPGQLVVMSVFILGSCALGAFLYRFVEAPFASRRVAEPPSCGYPISSSPKITAIT